jgi:cellulose synthase/poly-beta-1,6-N-acetylglucosamine synthase-like glycosyltransferase
MISAPQLLIASAVAVPLYAYVGYPLLLRLAGARPVTRHSGPPDAWPMISITVPAYNEAAQIRYTIESLLALDYPAEKRQILVVSDGSTDSTDEIVTEYADRGVELVRTPTRLGKTGAEHHARASLRGEIIVNTDASIRIRPNALKPLIAAFADPTVGLASGRDLSVASVSDDSNIGESGYVGYEMWVRALETRVGSIVGASGCFYAIRAELHRGNRLPEGLSRDFAAALHTRENGFRAISVDEAVCLVPRTTSLRSEYRRKVRTMARGLQTLFHKRALLNPFRYGSFAWMLFSHKLCRWLVPWAAIPAAAAIALLAFESGWARLVLGLAGGGLVTAALLWEHVDDPALPRVLRVPLFALASNLAALHAWVEAVRGTSHAFWEPTRRERPQESAIQS